MNSNRLLPSASLLILLSFLGRIPTAAASSEIPLKGIILGDQGRPLQGATVEIVPLTDPWGPAGLPSAPRVQTGASGAFSLMAPSAGLWRVIVRAPGFASSARDLVPLLEELELPLLRMESARALPVRIRDQKGQPLVGALLHAEVTSPERRRDWTPLTSSGTTGADGTATLEIPAGSPLRLTVLAEGFAPKIVKLPGSPTFPVEVRLDPGVPFQLEARDREGSPIADARVEIDSLFLGATGKDGRLTLALPMRKEVPIRLLGEDGRWAAGFLLGVETPKAPIPIHLEPPRSVQGRVVDGTTGKPVPGALVWAEGAPTSMVRTDRQGRYALMAPFAAPTVQVRAEAAGFLGAASTLDAQEDSRLLVLRPVRSAQGRILDPQGHPVAGAAVLVVSRTPSLEGLPHTEGPIAVATDAGGRFRLERLALGRIGLEVRARGFVPATVDGLQLSLGKGVADLGTFSLETAARFEGRVVDPSERPIPGAEVQVEGISGGAEPEAVTGSGGEFALDGLRAGEILSLRVSRHGYAAVSLDAITIPPEERVTVVLPPAGRVAGTVMDEAGEPVGGASLLLTAQREGAEGPDSRIVGTAASGADGRFAAEGVEPGLLALTVMAPGFLPSIRSDLDLPQGGELSGLEVVLERGAAVEGTVSTPSGGPAPGARLTLVDHGVPGSFATLGLAQAMTDDEGGYRLEGVAEGQRSIRVEWAGLPPVIRNLQVQAGTNRLDVRLRGGTEVSGRVVTSAGEPVEAAELRLLPLQEIGGDPPNLAVSAADGSFRFAAIPTGRYRLQGSRQGYAGLPRDLEVAGSPVSGLELRLDRGGALSGRLLGLSPAELSKVEVRASSPLSPRDQVSQPAPDGAWRMDDLGPGAWSVVAQVQGTSRAARGSVVIEPGREAVLDLEIGGGFTLSGRVEHDRRPVGQALVILQGGPVSGTGRTGDDGRFRIEGLAGGGYSIHIVHPSSGLQHNGPLEIDRNLDLSFEIGMPASVKDRKPDA